MDKAKKDRRYAAQAHERKMLEKASSVASTGDIAESFDTPKKEQPALSSSHEGTTVDKSLREYPFFR